MNANNRDFVVIEGSLVPNISGLGIESYFYDIGMDVSATYNIDTDEWTFHFDADSREEVVSAINNIPESDPLNFIE